MQLGRQKMHVSVMLSPVEVIQGLHMCNLSMFKLLWIPLRLWCSLFYTGSLWGRNNNLIVNANVFLIPRFHGNLPVTRSISEDGRDQAVLPEGGRRKNLSGSITEDDWSHNRSLYLYGLCNYYFCEMLICSCHLAGVNVLFSINQLNIFNKVKYSD